MHTQRITWVQGHVITIHNDHVRIMKPHPRTHVARNRREHQSSRAFICEPCAHVFRRIRHAPMILLNTHDHANEVLAPKRSPASPWRDECITEIHPDRNHRNPRAGAHQHIAYCHDFFLPLCRQSTNASTIAFFEPVVNSPCCFLRNALEWICTKESQYHDFIVRVFSYPHYGTSNATVRCLMQMPAPQNAPRNRFPDRARFFTSSARCVKRTHSEHRMADSSRSWCAFENDAGQM